MKSSISRWPTTVPTGLVGLVMNTMRVRSVMASRNPFRSWVQSGLLGTSTYAAPNSLAMMGYMEKACLAATTSACGFSRAWQMSSITSLLPVPTTVWPKSTPQNSAMAERSRKAAPSG